jgi:threonine dehydrogenase-like Zn-dependent dehydrogenase
MTAAPAVAAGVQRAAVLEAPRRARLVRPPIPVPAPGEVLVRIDGCGVCASNVPVWEGRPWFDYPLEPGAPGHEAWGVEVESGRRVALLSQRGFAEYAAVPADELVPLPAELDGMPFPGEPLGCATNVFARSGVRAGDTVAVVGCGFLGLLLVQLCVAAGARTLAFSRRGSALALARSFGADTPADAVDESCDVAIETGGVQATLDLAARLCRVRGRLVVAGYHQDGRREVDLQLWNWRGLDVVNAHERDPALYVEGIRAAAAAVVSGRLDPGPLLTHVLPLERLGEAMELARMRPEGFVKALVTTS